jgi:hypothetical protein
VHGERSSRNLVTYGAYFEEGVPTVPRNLAFDGDSPFDDGVAEVAAMDSSSHSGMRCLQTTCC